MLFFTLAFSLCLVLPSRAQTFNHPVDNSLNDFVGFKNRPFTPETHFKYLGSTAVATEFAKLSFHYNLHAIYQSVNDIVYALVQATHLAPLPYPTKNLIFCWTT